METTETRDQTLKKIEFYLQLLTDTQLRMVCGFMRGILRNRG